MAGSKNSNRLARFFLDVFKSTFEQFNKTCPLKGRFAIINASANSQMMAIYPVGTFQMIVNSTYGRNVSGIIAFGFEVTT